jgi:hypothetical protein
MSRPIHGRPISDAPRDAQTASAPSTRPNYYSVGNTGSHASAYLVSHPVEPAQIRPPWLEPPRSPTRKRSAGTMTQGSDAPGAPSVAYPSAGPSTERITMYLSRPYFRAAPDRDSSSHNGRSLTARQPTNDLPGIATTSAPGNRLSQADAPSAPAPRTSFSPSAPPQGSSSGSAAAPWAYAPLSMRSHQTSVPSWNNSYSYNNYYSGMPTHTQSSMASRHVSIAELQHPVTSSFPLSSQPAFPMTATAWSPYPT